MMENSVPPSRWATEILPILNEGYRLKIPFTGLSMYPFLAGRRDQAVIAAVSRKLKRGDIVLFVRDDGTHIMHRIHHVKGNTYYMLGDAQTAVEGPVQADRILALITAVSRKNKMIPCSRIDFKVFSHIWLFLRPFRPLMIRMYRWLRTFL